MKRRIFFALGLVGLAISLIPVLSHDFISSPDLYNHMARAYVLANYDQTAWFRAFWLPHWAFVPNLALDVIAAVLLPWFSMAVVTKILLTLCFVGLAAGGAVLARVVHGRWSATSLLVILLLFNRSLMGGLVNYLLGIALCLFGTAAWIALRDRPALWRGAVLCGFASVICAVHLFAFGILGCTIAGVELAILYRRRAPWRAVLADLAVPALAALPALALLVFAAPPGAGGGTLHFRSLVDRLTAFAVPLTYAAAAEAVGFALIGVGLLLCWRSGQLRVDRRLAAGVALLVLIQLAMPDTIGVATGADHRIPIAIWILAICALDLRPTRAWVGAAFVAMVAAFGLARVGIVQQRWTADDRRYATLHRVLADIPAGMKVATAYPSGVFNSVSAPALALYFLPAWELVPRGAFTQTLWTKPSQHPLLMQPKLRALADATGPEEVWSLFVSPTPPADAPLIAAVGQYDYVVFLSTGPYVVTKTAMLDLVGEADGIALFKRRGMPTR